MQNMAKSQVKRMKMALDAEERRDERKSKERMEEAERNRKHELEIAKIYAAAFASNHQQNLSQSTLTHFQPAFPSASTLSQNYRIQDHYFKTFPLSSPSPSQH